MLQASKEHLLSCVAKCQCLGRFLPVKTAITVIGKQIATELNLGLANGLREGSAKPGVALFAPVFGLDTHFGPLILLVWMFGPFGGV